MKNQTVSRIASFVALAGLLLSNASFAMAAAQIPTASFTLSPDNGLAGSSVQVNGQLFSHNESLTLTFNGSTLLTFSAGNGGQIAPPQSFTVPNLAPGNYDVVISGADDTVTKTFTINPTPDTTAPVIAEVTPVSSPTADNTPDYVFSSTEAGTITYGSPCSSATTSAVVGQNAVSFNTLSDGTYSTCTVTVTDAANNVSNVLNVFSFTVDTSVPVVPDTTAPTLPVHNTPLDNSTTTTALLTSIDWSDSTDVSMPVTYVYQSANDPAVNGDGSFVNPIYTSGDLSSSETPTLGTPAGVYYWHVKAKDSVGNESAWTTPWKVTVDNSIPVVIPTIEACNGSTFDSGFNLGLVNGQNGWSDTGLHDEAVVDNTYGFPTFGCKTLRISDAISTGGFAESQVTTPYLAEADAAGEASIGATKNHFEGQFDIASALPALQAGMHMSISPMRGDESRMSYIRLEDQADGIEVFFDDVQGENAGYQAANFVETKIATLTRTPHTIKFVMDFVDGPSNDVVKIYIDGTLVHTGTSWENYYRFDTEANPQVTRSVRTIMFRESGDSNIANSGNGFLIDNVSLSSSNIVAPTPTYVTTDAASTVTSSDATLNATNGDSAATGHSFWVSTSPTFTITGTDPAADGALSTIDFGAVNAGTAFSANLSSIAGLSVAPNTTYYFVAWSLVDGVWHHGDIMNFKTLTAPENPQTFTLTYQAAAHGSISGTAVQAVTENTSGSAVTAVANPGYHFSKWNDGVLTATRSDVATATETFIAQFARSNSLVGGSVGQVLGASTGPGEVLGAANFVFSLFLKMGPPYHFAAWGNEVMELQKFLNGKGYSCGPVDGKFGPLTKACVVKFQLDNGLVGDGIVGPKTREVLNK